jgi:hypothetical protein
MPSCGLCSRALRFPGGKTLEELVLGNALGQPAPAPGDEPARPSGVFVLPVPLPGVLRGTGTWGFIFAEADTRHDVGKALTAARGRLYVVIG